MFSSLLFIYLKNNNNIKKTLLDKYQESNASCALLKEQTNKSGITSIWQLDLLHLQFPVCQHRAGALGADTGMGGGQGGSVPQDSYRIPTSGHTASGALWGTGNVNSWAFRALSFCTIVSAIQRKKKKNPAAPGIWVPNPASSVSAFPQSTTL